MRSAILKGFALPVVSRKLPLYPWAGSETTGPGPVSGERNSSPTPAFNQPTVLAGEKLGMEASGREEGLWPCAGPNAAHTQNRLAGIVLAAMRFLLLLTDDDADMDGLSIFLKKPGRHKSRRPWVCPELALIHRRAARAHLTRCRRNCKSYNFLR